MSQLLNHCLQSAPLSDERGDSRDLSIIEQGQEIR